MRLFASLLSLIVLLAPVAARADWDPVQEAKDEAARKAAQAEESRRHAEVERMKHQATMQSKRDYVGQAAQGKADSEINKLYDQKIAQQKKDSAVAMAQAQEAMKMEAQTRPQRDAAMKQMFGKDTKEMMEMSDEELEAMAAQLEKQYGGVE